MDTQSNQVLASFPLETPLLIAGGGGFIGGWLVSRLQDLGYTNIRAVDIKNTDEWFQVFDACDNRVADLRDFDACKKAVPEGGIVFNLAADMGGMGFIESNKAACMLSSLINTHLLLAARDANSPRFFFASSACVYNADKQSSSAVNPLREEDAYPAMPEDGYGWEKLFGERMVRHFREDFGLEGRVGRYHNVYGPQGTWTGGREKAPAAICRKVAEAVVNGSGVIEIWGDGEQTRSFTFIDDALTGTLLLCDSDVEDPLNIGSEELVTINELVSIVESIAGVTLERSYQLDAPKGVRGRNSDNTRIRAELGWSPSVPLVVGIRQTYEWVYAQLKDQGSTR